jgi:hypothetical protein
MRVINPTALVFISIFTTSNISGAPPVFTVDNPTKTIPENVALGKLIFAVEASDPDGSALTYTISPNEFFYYFPEEKGIFVKKALDYETTTSHSITLTATDAQDESSQQALTLHLQDCAEVTHNPSDLGMDFPGQDGTNQTPITRKRYAVYMIRFKDAETSLFPGGSNAIFPTKEEMLELLNGDEIKHYWRANSWGQYEPEMDVFGYFEHPKAANEYPQYPLYEDYLNDLGNIQITDSGFDVSNYDYHVFLFMNDTKQSWSSGARAGAFEFTINGTAYGSNFSHQGILHGTQRNLDGTLALWDPMQYGIINESGVWEEGLQDYRFSKFQRTYLLEAGHSLGLSWHENSSINGNLPAWRLKNPNENITTQLNDEYGNLFSIMGNSQFSLNMTANSRDYLGWNNASNRYSIKKAGKHTVRIQPLNRTTGYRVVEIRIPHRTNQFASVEGFKNHGYFLEVREIDLWSKFNNPAMTENTKGVLLYATDGGGSRLLDASPSPLVDVNWGNIQDYRNLALKPGTVYENHEVHFSNVIDHGDGSFSIDIELFPNTGAAARAIPNIQNFRSQYFSTTANSGSAADDADPDGDGLPNLVEHALGYDPTSKNQTPLLIKTTENNNESFVEIQIKTPVATEAETTLTLEGSTDLIHWNTNYFNKVDEVIAHNFDARADYNLWKRLRLSSYRSVDSTKTKPILFWRLKAKP